MQPLVAALGTVGVCAPYLVRLQASGRLQPLSPLLAPLLLGGQSFQTQCYVFRRKWCCEN